ncbi:MAG: glycyl-radical enzyme activating protein [Oscillospiraceae bacterium]|nr:glycyl-radical enzyme activating protein [Oscillospiraceae bacterium]
MVFGVQHFSIHDGNGVRTNVFLMGCPLRCLWCHNPEGILKTPSLSFSADRCTGCGACFSLCPEVHQTEGEAHILKRENCRGCFECVAVCKGHALEQVGREMTLSEVMDDVMRDKRYYDASGGGVTLSGGEPMSQFEFTKAVLESCREAGINTAMETCGVAPQANYAQILPLVDTFLYDIKESDPALHRQYTGADNALILSNLAFLSESGARIILRCPIIPGLNDRPAHFEFIAALSKKHPGVEGIELMPYHKLGVSKTSRMGLDRQESYEAPSDETAAHWNEAVLAAGGKIVEY